MEKDYNNKNYTPDYKDGIIGIRFVNHTDGKTIDDNGDFIIDFDSFLNHDDSNNKMMSYFENKYKIKFIEPNTRSDTSFLFEYYFMFSCPSGKEDEYMEKISSDKMVERCSRIDNRIIDTNDAIENVYDSLEQISNLEITSLSDSEIEKNINDAIDILKKLL